MLTQLAAQLLVAQRQSLCQTQAHDPAQQLHARQRAAFYADGTGCVG